MSAQNVKTPFPWSKREAAQYLGISIPTLNRKLGKIPHIKLGPGNAPVRFSPEELEDFLGSVHRGGRS